MLEEIAEEVKLYLSRDCTTIVVQYLVPLPPLPYLQQLQDSTMPIRAATRSPAPHDWAHDKRANRSYRWRITWKCHCWGTSYFLWSLCNCCKAGPLPSRSLIQNEVPMNPFSITEYSLG